MATQKIYEFLSKHNRPYSVNDVVQGLGDQSIGKSKVQKSLEQLVDQNKVIEKTYGKQKIYCLAQNQNLPATEAKQQIFEINRQSTSIAGKLEKIQKTLQDVNGELKQLDGITSLEEANLMKADLEDEIDLLENKLDSIKSCSMDPKEAKAIVKQYEDIVKEYRKRKRLCNDIVEAIFENYPKSKKHLLEEIGIETDEDVGFVIKNLD